MLRQEIILLSENSRMPEKGTSQAACWDLFSPDDFKVPAGEDVFIQTNVAVAWNDDNYYMQLFPRSGLALKYKITCHPGVIDYDYRKNIGVILRNNSSLDYYVKKNDKIAQYTFLKIANVDTHQVEEFSIPLESNRTGGFGSTGK